MRRRRDDQVVLAKGYGVRDVNTGESVTPRPLFAVGSTTALLRQRSSERPGGSSRWSFRTPSATLMWTSSNTSRTLSDRAEILWDEWGVPHIFAGSSESAL